VVVEVIQAREFNWNHKTKTLLAKNLATLSLYFVGVMHLYDTAVSEAMHQHNNSGGLSNISINPIWHKRLCCSYW